MKVACEACNKAVNSASKHFFDEWKSVVIKAAEVDYHTSPLEMVRFESAYLCPECLKTARAFIFAPDQCQEQKEETPDGEAIEH